MAAAQIIKKIWQAVRQSAVIIILAATAGLLINQARSNSLPLVADWTLKVRLASDSGESMVISIEEAKDLCSNKGAVFLDARSPEDYARGHIRCAENIPWQAFDEYIERVWDKIPEDAWVVTYCDGETCSLSEDLAKELVSMGYEKVKVLLNGWTRWREAGLPVEKGVKQHSRQLV